MEKELIINATRSHVEIALLEDGKLVELHRQDYGVDFNVGDIFLGRVKKLMPGLNAAFVDIGHKRDAFLHYTDLGPQLRSLLKWTRQSMGNSISAELHNFQLEPPIIKTGKITDVLRKNMPIMVQILKEPISTKGPRLSCELTLPGRYVVLCPFQNFISVSKKIARPDERLRLRKIAESIRPPNFGLIVRTAAEGKRVAELHQEIRDILHRWGHIHRQLKHATPPKKLLAEMDKTSSILRDILTDEFHSIVVNNHQLYNQIKALLQQIAPEKVKILKLYKSSTPIFTHYNVAKQIRASFGKTTTLKSGSYIVIERTEAMHVIDVNSGPKPVNLSQEEAAIKVNLEAAEEIARQLRLRDLGGLIVIDFIDMRNPENKKLLYQRMREFMASDRAQHTILPLSRFGLMQITRQRVRPEVQIDTTSKCPTCGGSGIIESPLLVIDRIERDIHYILTANPKVKLSLHAHPFVAAYLTKGFPSMQMKWWWKSGKWVKIVGDEQLGILEYKFYGAENNEIRLNRL